MNEQWPYLPKTATLDEASAWLEEVTGECWPLPRLLEYGLWPSVWLAPDPAGLAPEVMARLFGDKAEGFLAPVCFAGDVNRLAVTREGCLTMTRSEAGEFSRFTPGTDFTISGLRFHADALKEHATRFCSKPGPTVEKLKRNALIDRYSRDWESIKSDLSEASRNGLSVAKLEGGFWDVAKVLAWGKAKGKPTESRPPAASPWPRG
jgi:hypothetical protein